MHTNLSRRAFACGASLAALSAFPTLAEVNASPDHELLVLGAQLDRVLVERYTPEARASHRGVSRLTDGESDDFWDEVNGLTNDLCEQILEIEPKTFDGLRVHARAISACSQHVWDDDEQTSAFLERVCRMLGTSALESDIGRGRSVL
jgi:hypothetical protein